MIALLAGPDFPIPGVLFTGPLTFPYVDPKNRSPAILVRLGCSPVLSGVKEFGPQKARSKAFDPFSACIFALVERVGVYAQTYFNKRFILER